MNKLNKKGFTLIELLAVIVILAILVTVSIPSITKYMDSSRKETFAINVSRAIEAIRTDISSGAVSSTKKYTLAEINALLDKKLNKSSYGNNYDSSSYIEVTIVDDRPTYEICIIDSKGNGIDKKSTSTTNDVESNLNIELYCENDDYVYEHEYAYTGSEESVVIPKDGYYKVELKGGEGGTGGNSYGSGGASGKGGYISSIEYLRTTDIVSVIVGNNGSNGFDSTYITHSYSPSGNGGAGGYPDGTAGQVSRNNVYAGGGGGGGGSTQFIKNSTLILRANGGGGGGGGSSTMVAEYNQYGGDGGTGGVGIAGGLGVRCDNCAGTAGSNGTYYTNGNLYVIPEHSIVNAGSGSVKLTYLTKSKTNFKNYVYDNYNETISD